MPSYPVLSLAAAIAAAYVAGTVVAALLTRLGFPISSSGKRFVAIDGLRGYLALSVVAHHFILWMQVTRGSGTWSPPKIAFFNELGVGAVTLFFMITGFLFYPRIVRGFHFDLYVANVINRVFRIVPLVATSVALVTIVIVHRTSPDFTAGYFLRAAEWLTSWGEPPLLGYRESGQVNAYVLWSLWYEWMFYLLILPACAIAMGVLFRLGGPTWIVPLAVIGLSLAARRISPSFGLANFLPLFAVGMIAYEIQQREPLARWFRAPVASVLSACGLLAAMALFETPYQYALPLFGFFFVCVACGNTFGGLLQTKGAQVLGECSYGIYLLHGILLSLMFVEARPLTGALPTDRLPIVLPLAAALIVPITALTYLLVERVGIRWGATVRRLWLESRTPRPAGLFAPAVASRNPLSKTAGD